MTRCHFPNCVWILGIKCIERPSIGGNFGDGIGPRPQKFREAFGVAHAARKTQAHSDNRDRFVPRLFRFRELGAKLAYLQQRTLCRR